MWVMSAWSDFRLTASESWLHDHFCKKTNDPRSLPSRSVMLIGPIDHIEGVSITCTLRFFAFDAAVVLGATGSVAPNPLGSIRVSATPN